MPPQNVTVPRELRKLDSLSVPERPAEASFCWGYFRGILRGKMGVPMKLTEADLVANLVRPRANLHVDGVCVPSLRHAPFR